MELKDQIIEEIVQRILSVVKPDKIILFGSGATGRMTPDSDVDLLIVMPDTRNQREEYVRIRRALWDIEFSFDILFISTAWFDQSKETPGGIAYPARKNGKLIYEAA